jgi:hypothetical protein
MEAKHSRLELNIAQERDYIYTTMSFGSKRYNIWATFSPENKTNVPDSYKVLNSFDDKCLNENGPNFNVPPTHMELMDLILLD